jgi:hypothetical protein
MILRLAGAPPVTSNLETPLIRFWNNLTALQAAAVISALILTIGAIVEYWDKLKLLASLLLKWTLRKSTPFDRCVFRKLLLHSIGPILVVLGIAGEVIFEGRTFVVEDRQEEQSRKIVGSLRDKAGQAETKAQSALDESSLAETKANVAATTASSAETLAGKAQQNAGAVAKQADELNHDLLTTKTQLATVDAKREELEKSLNDLAVCNAPRVILRWFLGPEPATGTITVPGSVTVTGTGNGTPKTYADPLKPMAGQTVFIEFVPEAEARRAAFNIAQVLIEAKWNVHDPLKVVDGLADGVSVQPAEPARVPNGQLPNVPLYWSATQVAEKLVDFLHSYNWQAARGWPIDAQGNMIHDENILPAGSIRIQIGLYPPAVNISPPAEKELASRVEALKKQRQEVDAEVQRQREERLAKLPPETQQELRQAMAESDAKLKNAASNGPCQVLNPPF